MFLLKNKKKHKRRKHIICYMLLIPECDRPTDRQTHIHRQTHDDGIYRASIAQRGKNLHSRFMLPLVCNGVVASRSFFEVCLLPFSSSTQPPTEVQW